MENKVCNCCNESKSITEFSYRTITYNNKNKNQHTNYIYRFLDKNDKILYIGKTETNLNVRINSHFTQGHLPKECYDEISKIEFLATSSKAMMDIKEIYYINIYKPKYNANYINDEPPILINDFQNDRWRDFSNKEIKFINNEFIDHSYIFEPSQITSIFYRQRTENFLVYLEIKTTDNKKKQIRKGTFKTEDDAKALVEKLKTLYK